MSKKFAMIVMDPEFDPQRQQARLDTPHTETHIRTVRSPAEAAELAVQLADQGFGSLEVCGAFGEELARRMYEAAGRRLTVGYVVCPPDQLEANERFWNS